MLQLTFSPRDQLETSYRFAGSALPLIASMSPSTTGKECRDHHRETDVVRSRTKSTGIDYQSSGTCRALEDSARSLVQTCACVCVVCTFELYGSCGRVWLACTLHICTRPTKGATGPTAPNPDSPNGMQRTGPGRVPVAAAVVLVQASTWVDRSVGNPALRRGALIGFDRSLWQCLGCRLARADDVGLLSLTFETARSGTATEEFPLHATHHQLCILY